MGTKLESVLHVISESLLKFEWFIFGNWEKNVCEGKIFMNSRIFLSPPHMGGEELQFITEAFDSNYIAPLGPQVDLFESEFVKTVQSSYGAAVSSGTAALHLVLRYVGIKSGDEVLCSSFTFVATANAIGYLGAKPVFVDSDYLSWNMDPILLERELELRAKKRKIPRALVLVHLYGQPADIDPIVTLCERYNIILIEDAAESLGALYRGKPTGSFGKAGIFSFNGNKIITTSGGGMIVSGDAQLIEKVKFWATQARDTAPYYQHSEIGYNYRMSNVLAAIGRGQLKVLEDRVEKKREIFSYYKKHLSELPGVDFMPTPEWAYPTHWLTCLTIDPDLSGVDRDTVMQELEKHNIESRPTWKPMHLQPLFENCDVVGGSVSEYLFRTGLCLPSGTALSAKELERIVFIIRSCWGR
jgi:pyridoxal phosphate-dependent aminotransferase EpsN